MTDYLLHKNPSLLPIFSEDLARLIAIFGDTEGFKEGLDKELVHYRRLLAQQGEELNVLG